MTPTWEVTYYNPSTTIRNAKLLQDSTDFQLTKDVAHRLSTELSSVAQDEHVGYLCPNEQEQQMSFGQWIQLYQMRVEQFYYMKQLIEIKVNNAQQKQEIYLPHLRTKSLSIPSTKFHPNSMSRYDRKIGEHYMVSYNKSRNDSRKWVAINLQEIQKKAKIDQALKLQAHLERKKIISQYQTIDLWKERYSPQDYILPRKPTHKQQLESTPISEEIDLDPTLLHQQKVYHLKGPKQSSLQMKMVKKSEQSKYIPDEVVIHQIKELQMLKNDDKLEAALKREMTKEQFHVRRNFKSSLPVFQKISMPAVRIFKKQEENPTKWEIQKRYTQQQSDHF